MSNIFKDTDGNVFQNTDGNIFVLKLVGEILPSGGSSDAPLRPKRDLQLERAIKEDNELLELTAILFQLEVFNA